MEEYLPKHESISRRLQENEELQLGFTVVNTGTIIIQVFARRAILHQNGLSKPILDPTRRKVELFIPGSNQPIESKTDSGYTMMTTITHEVLPSEAALKGDWICTVTNLEDRSEQFSLSVTYPGTVVLKTAEAPVSLVQTFMNSTFGQMAIHITDGDNASYIVFPDSLELPDYHFTVPAFKKNINLPYPIPDIAIRERVNDINSNSHLVSLNDASTQFPNGSMRLTITFEESEKEILGTFHAQMSEMLLTIDLGLQAKGGKISYNVDNVRTNFSANINVLGVPNWLEKYVLDPIFNYSEQIRRSVATMAQSIYADKTLEESFSSRFTTSIAFFLGPNPHIVSVTVEDGKLKIRYYNG